MKYIKKNRGFTLIEMIVSLGIFTVVAVIAIGALLKISDANRKAITLKTAINNLNFALESMSREIRLGSNYECQRGINDNGACSNSGNQSWLFTFDSTKIGPEGCNLRYAYLYDYTAKTIKKAEEKKCNSGILNLDSSYSLLVSPDIRIKNSILDLNNSGKSRVFFWMHGEVGKRISEKTEFSLQTTVSQRQ